MFDPKAADAGAWRCAGRGTAPRSSLRLAPTIVHDIIDAGLWRTGRTLRERMDDPIEEKLSDIEAPTLVVRPERDHLVPEAWTERVAELIPDSELVTLPKAATRSARGRPPG